MGYPVDGQPDSVSVARFLLVYSSRCCGNGNKRWARLDLWDKGCPQVGLVIIAIQLPGRGIFQSEIRRHFLSKLTKQGNCGERFFLD